MLNQMPAAAGPHAGLHQPAHGNPARRRVRSPTCRAAVAQLRRHLCPQLCHHHAAGGQQLLLSRPLAGRPAPPGSCPRGRSRGWRPLGQLRQLRKLVLRLRLQLPLILLSLLLLLVVRWLLLLWLLLLRLLLLLLWQLLVRVLGTAAHVPPCQADRRLQAPIRAAQLQQLLGSRLRKVQVALILRAGEQPSHACSPGRGGRAAPAPPCPAGACVGLSRRARGSDWRAPLAGHGRCSAGSAPGSPGRRVRARLGARNPTSQLPVQLLYQGAAEGGALTTEARSRTHPCPRISMMRLLHRRYAVRSALPWLVGTCGEATHPGCLAGCVGAAARGAAPPPPCPCAAAVTRSPACLPAVPAGVPRLQAQALREQGAALHRHMQAMPQGALLRSPFPSPPSPPPPVQLPRRGACLPG